MSGHDAHSRPLRRRPSRALPSIIVAVLLLALGIALTWAAVSRLSSGSWPKPIVQAGDAVADLAWAATILLVVAGVIALLGMILLLAAVSPGKPSAMRIGAESIERGHDSTEIVMSRRSVARLARARAGEVDGVDSVSSTVGPRTVSLSVKTTSEKRAEIQASVTSAVQEALSAVGLDPMPRVAAKVRTRNP